MKKPFFLAIALFALIFFSAIASAECVDTATLAAYIAQWKTDSTTFTMPQLMLKIADWKSGAGCGTGIIAASIVASRVECVAPCAVFFDATDTIATTTTRPFNELDYTWDFGDPSAGNWATNGKSKNLAKGGVAAHVFENAGNYIVNLNVKDISGNSDSKTAQITVQNPDDVFASNTVCFSTGTDFTGCPSEAVQVTTNDIATALNTNITNGKKRLLLRRGDSWTTSSRAHINVEGPGIIGAFGSGNKPEIQTPLSSDNFSIIVVANNNWVIRDLFLQGPSTEYFQPGSKGIEVYGKNNILVQRNKITKTNHVALIVSDYDAKPDAIFFVENEANQNGGYGMYAGGNRIAILGNNFTELGQHVLRAWYMNKGVISENKLLDPTVHYPERSGALALKFHNSKSATGLTTQNVIISGNDFRGRVIGVAIEPQNAQAFELIDNIIFEKNTVSSNSQGEAQVLLGVSATNITVRNNIFLGDGSSPWPRMISVNQATAGLPVGPVWAYNNLAYKSEAGTNTNNEFTFLIVNYGEIYANNNLAAIPNFIGYRQKFYYTLPGSESLVNIHKSNNLFYSPNMPKECINPLGGNTCINPLFIDETQENFHLQSTSPAVNAGTVIPGLFEDYLGNARDSQPDIGTYEYH